MYMAVSPLRNEPPSAAFASQLEVATFVKRRKTPISQTEALWRVRMSRTASSAASAYCCGTTTSQSTFAIWSPELAKPLEIMRCE